MTNVLFYRPSQRGLFMLLPSDRHGSWRQVSLRRAGWLLLNHPRHASVHTAGSSMDVQTAYGILGLDSSVSLDGIKSAYRSLAKQYHPDKNSSHGSTALFQQLNHAYQTLIKCHLSAGHDGDSSPAGPVCVDSDITLNTKENSFSVTIDITDIMFLVILSVCESHHGVSPVDRGVNGQQLKFPYTSPGESEHYGSISLTFYPTTSRLLVQGSSYILWVDEHLPAISKRADEQYMQNAGVWTALARRPGIGLKHEGRPTRHSRSTRSSRSDDLSSADDLGHTPQLVDPPPPETSDASPATHCAQGDNRSPSPVSYIESPVHLACDANDATSVADLSPTQEGSSSTTHAGQSTEGGPVTCAPKTHKKPKCPKKKVAAKKKKKSVKFNLSDNHCDSKCTISGSDNMIRCSLCMSWFHVECTGEDAQYQGVWCCNSCRTLPKYVQGMTEKIDLLVSSLESIQNTEAALRAEVQLLKAENGKLRSKLSHAEHHNNELAKLIETMSFPASSGSGTSDRHEDSPTLNPYPPSQQHPSPPEPEQPWITVPTANRFELLNNSGVEQQSRPRSQSHTPQKRSNPSSTVTSSAGPSRHENITVTVIGSSIVRGVAPLVHGKGFDACGYVFPGCTAREINARIRHIPTSDVTVLAAGTNNIETQTIAECSKEVQQTIDNVARKRHHKTVIMSQLPHRFDKPKLNSKIDAVNSFIAYEVSKRPHWHLLKHNVSHDDLKPDGLHFNSRGIARYAHEIRHMIRTIKLE